MLGIPKDGLSRSRRGRPYKITRERMVEVASEMGLEDLKLSEVARRLNVTLQTLYNHVRDRDELLRLAAQVLEAQHVAPDNELLAWDDWWRQNARELLALYGRNPGLASILMARPLANSPPLSEKWEIVQRIAEREGFSPAKGLWANLAVHEFIYSWAAREGQTQSTDGSTQKGQFDPRDATDFPRCANAVAATNLSTLEERFEMTLDALLTGLLASR